MFTFVIPANFVGQAIGFLSIIVGAMLWWVGLTYLITRMKKSFGVRGILHLNRSIGTIVVIVSVVYAAMTLMNLSLY